MCICVCIFVYVTYVIPLGPQGSQDMVSYLVAGGCEPPDVGTWS